MSLHKGNYYKWRQQRQRCVIRQVTWQPRTWRLERRNWKLESSNAEHGGCEASNQEAITWKEAITRKLVPSKPFPSKRKRSGGSGGLPPPGYQSGKKKGGEAPRSPRLRAKRAGGFLTLLLARELSNEIGGALVQGQQSSLIRMGDTYFW